MTQNIYHIHSLDVNFLGHAVVSAKLHRAHRNASL